MLADLALPPGCSVRIDYDPDRDEPNATISVFRGDVWLGEVTANATRLAQPGELQKSVDLITNRGVRPVFELPEEGERVSPAILAASWRMVKCLGGPHDGGLVGIKGDTRIWDGAALIHTARGNIYQDPPVGGLYILEQDGMTMRWLEDEKR